MPAATTLPPCPTAADLRTAAALCADGAPWDAVALALGRTMDDVRRWPAVYAVLWDDLFPAAVAEARLEAACAATAALARHARSANEAISLRAAVALMRWEMARLRHGEGSSIGPTLGAPGVEAIA